MRKKLLYDLLEPYAVRVARTVLRGEGISNNPDLPDIGKGGNLLDLGIRYHHCSVAELLLILAGNFSFQKQETGPSKPLLRDNKVTILHTFSITSYHLLQYLEQRKIPAEIAERYCIEVRYQIGEKVYYGIGFKNNSGGYEIRNPFFKGSSSPKDITAISKGCNAIAVFEGFFDFLSFIACLPLLGIGDSDYLVLNSLALFEKARSFMERYDRVLLYLNRDQAGQNCSAYALSLGSRYIECSSLYKGFKDLNEWRVNTSCDSGISSSDG